MDEHIRPHRPTSPLFPLCLSQSRVQLIRATILDSRSALTTAFLCLILRLGVQFHSGHNVRRLLSSFHSWKSLCNTLEQSFDIVTCLCRCLDEHDFILLCATLSLLRRHLSTPLANGGRFNYRLSLRSVLFPTRTMITSFPRSARTSSTHFAVF